MNRSPSCQGDECKLILLLLLSQGAAETDSAHFGWRLQQFEWPFDFEQVGGARGAASRFAARSYTLTWSQAAQDNVESSVCN